MTTTITLSLEEAADMLGISRTTAYRLAATGEFPVPVFRVSARKRRVSRKQLEEFVDAGGWVAS